MTAETASADKQRKFLFWTLVAVQTVGVEIVWWEGIPVYHRLLADRQSDTTNGELFIAFCAIVAMQAAYWLARPIQSRLTFRRNVVVGHVLFWLAELSFFFPHALAAAIFFDRFEELTWVAWKAVLVVLLLFATYCFKRQLESLAEAVMPEGAEGNERESAE